MTTQCPRTRILTSEFEICMMRLRGRRRQGKRLVKKWINVFNTFITIIPTHRLCQMCAHSFELSSLGPYSSSEKCDASAKLFFCFKFKPVAFLTCSLTHHRPPYCPPKQGAYMYSLDFVSLRVLTERILERSMEPKFSSPKKSADIRQKTFSENCQP